MKFKAVRTSEGAFVLGLVYCDEFSLIDPLYFLLDTGSAISALSVMDLGEGKNYSGFKKKSEAAIGVGGALECYLIHNVRLFLLETEQRWIEIKKFDSMCLLPSSFNQIKKENIYLPSIIGRDLLGADFDLMYLRDNVYLKG